MCAPVTDGYRTQGAEKAESNERQFHRRIYVPENTVAGCQALSIITRRLTLIRLREDTVILCGGGVGER